MTLPRGMVAEGEQRRGRSSAEPADELATARAATGERVTGDAMGFALVATGRGDPATFGLDERVNVYR